MSKAIILSGSNLGDRRSYLRNTIPLIEKSAGKVIGLSSVFESEPWGFKSSNTFYNQLIILETNLEPKELLLHLQAIEKKLRRKRVPEKGYTDRTIDLDILFYDNVILNEPELILPHPAIAQRRFVLTPLVELFPSTIHPTFQKTFTQLLELCPDKGKVVRVEPRIE